VRKTSPVYSVSPRETKASAELRWRAAAARTHLLNVALDGRRRPRPQAAEVRGRVRHRRCISPAPSRPAAARGSGGAARANGGSPTTGGGGGWRPEERRELPGLAGGVGSRCGRGKRGRGLARPAAEGEGRSRGGGGRTSGTGEREKNLSFLFVKICFLFGAGSCIAFGFGWGLGEWIADDLVRRASSRRLAIWPCSCRGAILSLLLPPLMEWREPLGGEYAADVTDGR
jgi:hypothetical protein